MGTKKKSKTKAKQPAKAGVVEHLMKTEERIAACDRYQPSARFVRPLYRLRLVNPASHIGFLLLDVIAILPDRDDHGVVPVLYCLGGGEGDGWSEIWLRGEDAVDVAECYEVVS